MAVDRSRCPAPRWRAAALLLAAALAGARPAPARPVSDADLARPAGAEWLHSHGGYDGNRFSTLGQIHRGNAARLRVTWTSALGGFAEAQATPLIHDGVLYVPHDNRLHAFDARRGALLWSYEGGLPEDWGGQFFGLFTGKHRSAAIAGERVFFTTGDCTLHALHAASGALVFRRRIARPYPKIPSTTEDANGYVCLAGVMAIAGGKLIVPLNATDTGGLPGYVEGRVQSDGGLLWAANMIPEPGEPGAESWPGDSRLRGGAGPWVIGSWDAELRLYFTGTANAYPWSPHSARRGRGAGDFRNEGAASIVAVNTDTGRVAWRYAVVPGDPWDYDVPHTPMLVTLGGARTIVQPNKTGFIHYLDARTGRFLRAVRFADRITWATGYADGGEPLWSQDVPPPGQTVEVWPSMLGAVSHNPSAINPGTGMVYIASREIGMLWEYVGLTMARNVLSTGVAYENLSGGGEVERAFDLESGTQIWRRDEGKAGYAGGMLTTAGGLTFWANQGGELFAADARTGEVLWRLPVHVTAKAAPMTYLVDGRQQVTFALGGYGGVGSVADDWHNTNYTALLITIGL